MTVPRTQIENRNAPIPEPPLIHHVELAISYLLRTGVVVSIALIAFGAALTFVHHHDYLTNTLPLHEIPKLAADFPHTVGDTLAALRDFRGQGFILLGLLLLLITPVMRVAISIVAFAIQKDGRFALITASVLLVLILSFFLGKAGE